MCSINATAVNEIQIGKWKIDAGIGSFGFYGWYTAGLYIDGKEVGGLTIFDHYSPKDSGQVELTVCVRGKRTMIHVLATNNRSACVYPSWVMSRYGEQIQKAVASTVEGGD